MSGPATSGTALARPMPAAPLISVRNLSKSFAGPGGRPLPVLDDINLDVAEGEFVALLGRSGSGKSTLLRCIAGLIAPTTGEVLFRGSRLTGTNRETAMVFQTFALMPWLTVQQNVELGLEARGVQPADRTERALRAIDIVGLDGYESAFPKELSGGMRQRVGFARALVVEPAALLMDEPFSALDVLTSENLRGELLELWEGQRFPTKTIVMVTHNIEEAVLLADRILVLGTNPGRIRADMVNPLARPRRRRTPDFDELVDQIYRMMTQRTVPEEQPAATGAAAPSGTISDTPLPQATVDGLSGLAEIMLARHAGAADLADLAESLGLEVDDLLPLVDALVLLGFAGLHGDRLELSGSGQVFAGASIQDSKEIFARASLDYAPLVRTIYRSLRGSRDDTLPAGFSPTSCGPATARTTPRASSTSRSTGDAMPSCTTTTRRGRRSSARSRASAPPSPTRRDPLAAGHSLSTSARRPARARPTRCSGRAAYCVTSARTSLSGSLMPMAGRTPLRP